MKVNGISIAAPVFDEEGMVQKFIEKSKKYAN